MKFDGPCLCGEPPDPTQHRSTVQSADGSDVLIGIYRCARCGRFRGGIQGRPEWEANDQHFRSLLRHRVGLMSSIQEARRCVVSGAAFRDEPEPAWEVLADLDEELARYERWIANVAADLGAERP